MAPDGPRECRLAVVINIQDTVLGTQRAQLLLVVGNPGQELRLVQVADPALDVPPGATTQWPGSVGQRARNAMVSASS